MAARKILRVGNFLFKIEYVDCCSVLKLGKSHSQTRFQIQIILNDVLEETYINIKNKQTKPPQTSHVNSV